MCVQPGTSTHSDLVVSGGEAYCDVIAARGDPHKGGAKEKVRWGDAGERIQQRMKICIRRRYIREKSQCVVAMTQTYLMVNTVDLRREY